MLEIQMVIHQDGKLKWSMEPECIQSGQGRKVVHVDDSFDSLLILFLFLFLAGGFKGVLLVTFHSFAYEYGGVFIVDVPVAAILLGMAGTLLLLLFNALRFYPHIFQQVCLLKLWTDLYHLPQRLRTVLALHSYLPTIVLPYLIQIVRQSTPYQHSLQSRQQRHLSVRQSESRVVDYQNGPRIILPHISRKSYALHCQWITSRMMSSLVVICDILRSQTRTQSGSCNPVFKCLLKQKLETRFLRLKSESICVSWLLPGPSAASAPRSNPFWGLPSTSDQLISLPSIISQRQTILQLHITDMQPSLVDYVLQRGAQDLGEFAPRVPLDSTNALYNHRKLLAFLLEPDQSHSNQPLQTNRISDMKIGEISGQLNHFSQKMHAEISKKHLLLDADLYKVENQWLRKKIPDFYCYYFLKFAFANSYSRMHELFLSEMENMTREKDTYTVIRKTIEARESCLHALRKQLTALDESTILKCLKNISQENKLIKKAKLTRQEVPTEERGQSWRNQLESVFELMSHLRKLGCYVVELVRGWRNSIYSMSEDPRRYRERIIFYHNEANYLLKILFDTHFMRESALNNHLQFGNPYDPFLLRPLMVLDNKQGRSENEEILLQLVRPAELEMDKIVRALVVLAEQEYDENQQSRFLNQRLNYGEIEASQRQFIQKRANMSQSKSKSQQKLLPTLSRLQDIKERARNKSISAITLKPIEFAADKRSMNTQNQIQGLNADKLEAAQKISVEGSLSRLKKIRQIDLKKVSPYLNRNDRIEKAQKVIELEHKFRVAQSEYMETLKQKKEEDMKGKIHRAIEGNKDSVNGKIFNKYVQQNLKLMEEANRKAYLYKRSSSPIREKVVSSTNYNRVSYRERKEAEYSRNLQQHYSKDPKPANLLPKGTKSIIEISEKGIRAGQAIVDYQLAGKKGRNVGQILSRDRKKEEKQVTLSKLSSRGQTGRKEDKEEKKRNLFQSEKQTEIIIMRQEPQKIEQIKQYLYAKIKEELLQEMKKHEEGKEVELNSMIEAERQRKISQIMQERRREEQRRRDEQDQLRRSQLEKQRKQISFEIRIEPIQYAEQNIEGFFTKVFQVDPHTYHRLFLNGKLEGWKEQLQDQLFFIFLKGFYENEEVAYCIAKYDWAAQPGRKWIIQFLVAKHQHLYLSSLHQVIAYFWHHDPVEIIEFVLLDNAENIQGAKVVEDVTVYANRNGEVFEKRLYSNLVEKKFMWIRPNQQKGKQFEYTHFGFGKKFQLRAELLSCNISLNERHSPVLDLNLEVFTSYIFLLEELFRSYLTPEEVVELRENSTNIRRLKDIFRIVLQLEKFRPMVDQLTIVEGLNLDDVYEKLKNKKNPPYDKYYWKNFYDRVTSNRILLSMLDIELLLPFPINSCSLDDRRFMRLNPRRKILLLKSSIYSSEPIFILNTSHPKIRIFLMEAEAFKLMRMELFVFLNLLFNNIVEEKEKYIHSFWVPQFAINGDGGKLVRRITDFSISMKKSFFLGQEIYFCNQEYIKSAVSYLPKQSDLIFREAFIFGLLHTDIEQGSTGMPIYAKLIDRPEYF